MMALATGHVTTDPQAVRGPTFSSGFLKMVVKIKVRITNFGVA